MGQSTKPNVYSLNVSEKIRTDIEEAIEDVEALKLILEGIEKKITPIYDRYMPFKDVPIETKFVLRNHIYRKCKEFNMVGNTCNCFDNMTCQYEYLPDYEWVIKLD